MITSNSNVQIKNLIKLQKGSKSRKEQNAFVVEGTKMFQEAKMLGIVEKVYVSETFYKEQESYLEDIEYEVLADNLLKEVSDTMTPQGVLAIVKKSLYHLKDLFSIKKGAFLFLEDVRDPGNLGTMIRTAEGAGIKGIILSKESVDVYNPKVVRSTMGSLFRMPIVYVEDFQNVLIQAKKSGIRLFATDLQGTNNYDQEEYTEKCGIIIGNEANGISADTKKNADRFVKIPMEGKVESLNASVAAAIIMYEVFRQDRKSNQPS